MKLQHLKRVNSFKIGGTTAIAVILWEFEDSQLASNSVSRQEETIARKLAVIEGLDLDEVIEDELTVAGVAAFQPHTVRQFNQLRLEENYW